MRHIQENAWRLVTATAWLLAASAGCSPHVSEPALHVGFALEAPLAMCRVAGTARIVASDSSYGDVRVESADDGYDVLVMQGQTCRRLGIGARGEKLAARLNGCTAWTTPGLAIASNGTETYLARSTKDDTGASELTLGVVVYDLPHGCFGAVHQGIHRVVWRPFEAPAGGRGNGVASPALAPFGGDRFLLVWTEGGVVRAEPLSGWAQPAGAAFDVSPADATEVGRPSVAFGTATDGLVAFRTTTPTGSIVLAVPIACR